MVGIEVALISAIMLTGSPQPELARETMFASLMILMNGLIGLALLLGGIRHHEQTYNLEGARAFFAVILPLATFIFILPNFTMATDEPTLSPLKGSLFAVLTLALYVIFLVIQTNIHRDYFIQPGEMPGRKPGSAPTASIAGTRSAKSPLVETALLLVNLLPVVLLAKKLAITIEFGIAAIDAPIALGGVIIAFLVLAPEGLSMLKAAARNQLQRSVQPRLRGSHVDDRADRSGRARHRLRHRQRHRPRPAGTGHGSAGSYAGPRNADLRWLAD